MILDDETDPKSKKPKPRALDKMSVPELREYLTQLGEEQRRVSEEILKKEKLKAAADSLFKG
jgi:uncharacterized small protein (DUF1192 family)